MHNQLLIIILCPCFEANNGLSAQKKYSRTFSHKMRLREWYKKDTFDSIVYI